MSWPHPAQAVADALVAETLARGARDNVTVIVVRCPRLHRVLCHDHFAVVRSAPAGKIAR